jgi:hypothetical protein
MLAEQNKLSFEIGFEGSVSVDRTKMWKKGLKGVTNRGTSMPKTPRRESNVDTRFGRE